MSQTKTIKTTFHATINVIVSTKHKYADAVDIGKLLSIAIDKSQILIENLKLENLTVEVKKTRLLKDG